MFGIPARMPVTAPAVARSAVLGENDQFVVVRAEPGETLHSLAQLYLGDENLYWIIADFNDIHEATPGREIVIPREAPNPTQVYSNGFQTVPVLCYHRFGNGHAKLSVSGEAFEQQMAYLKDHGYRVIPLRHFVEFINGERAIPKRSVVITVDDGYRSTYTTAFPILKRFGYPATVFIYSDFIGAGDALTWAQIKAMTGSGLIDIQPHSKTHANLGLRVPDENEDGYAARIFDEVKIPSGLIEKHLNLPLHTFAYPYGDTSEIVIGALKRLNYVSGVTVEPGANAAFAYPFMLRRTMIFGDHGMDDFRAALQVFDEVDLR